MYFPTTWEASIQTTDLLDRPMNGDCIRLHRRTSPKVNKHQVGSTDVNGFGHTELYLGINLTLNAIS